MDAFDGADAVLAAGRAFAPEELVFYARRDERSLEQALADADVIVAAPHASAAIPEELVEHLDPCFAASARLRLDFTDVATRAVARRWAQLDSRVVLVENPHPRLVRDPNRPRPEDPAAELAEAFRRVREAGPGESPDLAGVDAVRPVTFAGLPVLTPPADDAALARLTATLGSVAARGVDVYERTRDDLFDRLVARRLRGDAADSGLCFFLSLHDTMNATAAPDGAIAGERRPLERMPPALVLANRGDPQGERRGREPVTVWPALLRRLADAHREGFALDGPQDVELNRPFLGGYEVGRFGAVCRRLGEGVRRPSCVFGAVQAEFRREFLLGEPAAAHLARPGSDWPDVPSEHIDEIARGLLASWEEFRSTARVRPDPPRRRS